MDDGPSQMDIDFKTRVQDEQFLDELRMIQEESGKMNEHGLGIFVRASLVTIVIYFIFRF